MINWSMKFINKRLESKNVWCCFNKVDNKKGSEIVMMKIVILVEKLL